MVSGTLRPGRPVCTGMARGMLLALSCPPGWHPAGRWGWHFLGRTHRTWYRITATKPSAPVFSFSWAQVFDHHEASEPSVLTFPFHLAASGALQPQAGPPGPFTTITYEASIEEGRPLRHTRSLPSETSRLAGSSRTPSLTLTEAAAHAPVSPGALLVAVGLEQRTWHVMITLTKTPEPQPSLS